MPAGRVPPLHLVTDDATLRDPGFASRAEAALAAGGSSVALHLRGPSAPARRLLELARALLPAARRAGAWLLVNDRVDVALAGGAHGAHLGARSLPLADARRLLGPGARIGASVHGLPEGEEAARAGADYLLAGTLFPTPSHPGRAGAGTGWLAPLARLGTPVVGIGGVTPARAPEVVAAGAAGVAVLRGVWEARDPAEAVHEYLRALNEGRTE